MKVLYEGEIGGYSFLMVNTSTIEVWTNINNNFPETVIIVSHGEIKNEKDFQLEIMDWYSKYGIL